MQQRANAGGPCWMNTPGKCCAEVELTSSSVRADSAFRKRFSLRTRSHEVTLAIWFALQVLHDQKLDYARIMNH